MHATNPVRFILYPFISSWLKLVNLNAAAAEEMPWQRFKLIIDRL